MEQRSPPNPGASAAQSSGFDLADDNDLLSVDQLDYQLDTTRLRTDAKYLGFDNNAGDTWIYPINYPVRRYQYDISHEALFRNTLVVLPTGLGKTFLAAVVMYNMYRWYPRGRVIFMAPTRPLVAQQIEACHQIMGLPRADTVELTGKQARTLRDAEWCSKRVFFVTPQVLAVDMRQPQFPVADVKLIVVDEAHKARGRYAYTEVIQWMHERNQHFRVLALSATPGRSVADVVQVVRNLRISHVAVRSETSADVAPYTHTKSIRTVVVRMGEALRDTRAQLLQIIDPYVQQLLDIDVISGSTATLSRNWLVMQQRRFVLASQQNRHAHHSTAMANFSTAISLYHALELLERHGVRIFLQFFADTDKKYLLCDGQLGAFVNDLRAELGEPDLSGPLPGDFDYGHPKYEMLRTELRAHFEQNSGDGTRALVFCEYVNSVLMIRRLLEQDAPLMRPAIFVGQSSVTQRQQIATMAEFRAGTVNVLVATCVAEEGIDVGDIDLIVCFDTSNKNPTRFVQRIGRTGRKRNGHVLMLVTEGREQQTLRDVMHNKDATNARLADDAELKAALVPSARMVPTEFDPQCRESFVKVPGVVPLAREGETSVKGMQAVTSSGSVAAVAGRKTKPVPKGVQDVRRFFKPVERSSEDIVAAPQATTPKQKSVIYEDNLHDSICLLSSASSTPIKAPPPAAISTPKPPDPRILQNLKNLSKIRDDMLTMATAIAPPKPVLTVNAVLKRGHKVPKSLQAYVVANNATRSSNTAPKSDPFASLFAELDLKVQLPNIGPLEMAVDIDECEASDSSPETTCHEIVMDEKCERTQSMVLPAETQLPLFIENESRYESYLQSPADKSNISSNVFNASKRNPKTPDSSNSSSVFNTTKRSAERPPRVNASSVKRRLQNTPCKTTPIREAFQKVRDMQSPRKVQSPKHLTPLTELLAFFQLTSILDMFDDGGARREDAPKTTTTTTKTPQKMSTTLQPEPLTSHEVSDLFRDMDESIVISSDDEPKTEAANTVHDTTAKRIEIGTIDDIFGSTDDMFASFVGVASRPRPESAASKHSSDEVIQCSQNTETRSLRPARPTLAAKLAVRRLSGLTERRTVADPLGQPTSQKENDVPQVSTPSRKTTANFEFKSPQSCGRRPVEAVETSPSVVRPCRMRRPEADEPLIAALSVINTQRVTPKPSGVLQLSRLRRLNLAQADVTAAAASANTSQHNLSVIGVRSANNVRRILESSNSTSTSSDDDDDFENHTAKAPRSATPTMAALRAQPRQRRTRRGGCAFVQDECEATDDEDCSADEIEPDESLMLNSMICNDEHTVNETMHAAYMRSVRSPRNPYGAYRMPANRLPINRSDIYSQFVPPDDDDATDDSFVVHDDDDDVEDGLDGAKVSSGVVPASPEQLDELDRAEMILRRRKRAKRKLCTDGNISPGEQNGNDAKEGPRKRRKIIRLLTSSSDEDEA